jgi:hypothetical protein
MALVSRDPFARQETHRERVYVQHTSCAWCGGTAHRGSRRWLYQYRTESDGGRKHEDSRLFCSASCRRSHND